MMRFRAREESVAAGRDSAATTSQATAEPDYWSQAREPLSCLAFLAPLLAVYEGGVLWLGETAANGADFWMRGWLHGLGLTQASLLPLLVAAGLLGWHVAGRHPWRISAETLVGMLAESLLFAFALIVLGQVQGLLFQRLEVGPLLEVAPPIAARAISLVGAGIYEEVLFRLCVLPAAYGVFRLSRLSVGWSAALAALASSLAFALAHHFAGEPLELYPFTFRTLAGLFFAGLFVLRGFGITVGCHAAYDLIVGVLLARAAS